ncbi:hypothetical protein [Effusibacillus dendaii]|nr:hypothetical protein [Effusibacillus dendaii]
MEDKDWFSTFLKIAFAAFGLLMIIILLMIIFAGNGMHNMSNM